MPAWALPRLRLAEAWPRIKPGDPGETWGYRQEEQPWDGTPFAVVLLRAARVEAVVILRRAQALDILVGAVLVVPRVPRLQCLDQFGILGVFGSSSCGASVMLQIDRWAKLSKNVMPKKQTARDLLDRGRVCLAGIVHE